MIAAIPCAPAAGREKIRSTRRPLRVEPKPSHHLFKDLTGLVFSRLTVIGYAGRLGGSHAFRCRCECGYEVTARGYTLTGGVARSCGCLVVDKNRELRTTHGRSKSREWRIWAGMKNRCFNQNVKSFANYGGRGITVCDRWLNGDSAKGGFERFYEDMGPRPSPRHSIERKNNDGNYEPSNCCWALPTQQEQNKRTTVRIEFSGRFLTAVEWSAETGISTSEINKRLRRGWSTERTLAQPMRGRSAT